MKMMTMVVNGWKLWKAEISDNVSKLAIIKYKINRDKIKQN